MKEKLLEKISEIVSDIGDYYNQKKIFNENYEKIRYNSIDITRGLLVIISIIVIFQGLTTNVNKNFIISPWNGLNLCDLILPGFLMLMGMSTPFYIKKYHLSGLHTIEILKKIGIRSFILFFYGIAYSLMFLDTSGMFRLTGPYQLISITYIVSSAIYLGFLRIKTKNNIITYVFLAMGIITSLILTYIVLKSGDTMESNKIISLDNSILRLYKSKSYVDPYGIVATITSIPVMMFGISIGCILNKKQVENKKYIRYKRTHNIRNNGFTFGNLFNDIKSWLNINSIKSICSNYYRLNLEAKKIVNMFIMFVCIYVLSKILEIYIPMNRNIFSISFNLRVFSYMLIWINFAYVVFDIIKIKNMTNLIKRIGRNSILVIFSVNLLYRFFSIIKIKSMYTGRWMDFNSWFTTDFLLPITGIDMASASYSIIWTVILVLVMNILERFDINISV